MQDRQALLQGLQDLGGDRGRLLVPSFLLGRYGERMGEVGRTVLALALLMLVAGGVPLANGVRQARAVAWSALRASPSS